jgi:hypothetical protein
VLVACGGGGGSVDFQPTPPPTPPPPGGTVTVSGKVTFDRIPFDTQAGQGLNPTAAIESPARGVVVEVVGSPGNQVLGTTVTDANGNYAVQVASGTSVILRVKAQMLRAGPDSTWDIRVLNNTNGDALYVLDSAVFSSGTADSTRNLRASSGWGTTSYTGTRAAAPFAILDTMYSAIALVLTALPEAPFPALNIYWSTTNKPTLNTFCIDDGDIGVTFYSTGGVDGTECDGRVPEGMYVLGDFTQGDTDEFDQHVLAHEFGHYLEANFARSDSIGGEHSDGDKLDLRVAFGEGWGNAFAGMVLNDPIYRDSFGGASSDFSINMEADDTRFGDGGWYSETSIAEILWDAFDAANEPGDTVTLGFPPIFTALRGEQRTTDALTSIFSFVSALKSVAPTSSAGLDQLRSAENISGTNPFGLGETNDGGDPSNLPVYRLIGLNDPQQPICVRATNGVDNKLGYNKFFRLDLNANATVTIAITGTADPGTPLSTAAIDPDVFVYRRGEVVEAGTAQGSTEIISQRPLAAGTYIIEVYDFALSGASAPRCMTIAVTGT